MLAICKNYRKYYKISATDSTKHYCQQYITKWMRIYIFLIINLTVKTFNRTTIDAIKSKLRYHDTSSLKDWVKEISRNIISRRLKFVIKFPDHHDAPISQLTNGVVIAFWISDQNQYIIDVVVVIYFFWYGLIIQRTLEKYLISTYSNQRSNRLSNMRSRRRDLNQMGYPNPSQAKSIRARLLDNFQNSISPST